MRRDSGILGVYGFLILISISISNHHLKFSIFNKEDGYMKLEK